MRITAQVIRSRAKKALHSVEYLDISNLEIAAIEKLKACPKLQSLWLKGNNIDCVERLDSCPHLWYLDLSHNKVRNLEGLSKFVALGTLILSNNEIPWRELAHLRHMHILHLSLHGNPELEKDPYYRIHVIDCLSNIWMLDGRIITSAERHQVEQFFNDTALSAHPVRHKLPREPFVPSSHKLISVNGVHGAKASTMFRFFPVNGALNQDTDTRRILYLCRNFQEDAILEQSYTKRKLPILEHCPSFLEELVEHRLIEREACNMLLLFLVASLEFALPASLVQSTLQTSKLAVVGRVYTMDLFMLPRDMRCQVASILLSAVKVDRDIGQEGGLYDRLYLALYHSVSQLMSLGHSDNTCKSPTKVKPTPVLKESKCLIASEVVQLMCIVASFFECCLQDVGLKHLVTVATGDAEIIEKLAALMDKVSNKGEEGGPALELVAEFLLSAIQAHAFNVINKNFKIPQTSSYVLKTSRALPKRPQSSPLYKANFHAVGRKTPDDRPIRIQSAKVRNPEKMHTPALGDSVLLSAQSVGKIISLPECDIALVQLTDIPVPNGGVVNKSKSEDDHYTYVNMKQCYWENYSSMWRPKGTIGDRVTAQYGEEGEDGHQESKPSQGKMLVDGHSPLRKQRDATVKSVSSQLKVKHKLKLTGRTSSDPHREVEHPGAPDTSPREISSQEIVQGLLDICINEAVGNSEENTSHNLEVKSSEHPSIVKDYETPSNPTNDTVPQTSPESPSAYPKSKSPLLNDSRPGSANNPIQVPSMDKLNIEDSLSEGIPDEKVDRWLARHRKRLLNGSTQSGTRASSAATSRNKTKTRIRPFSAVDAYQFTLTHPAKKLDDTAYRSAYQNTRTDAWRQSASDNMERVSFTDEVHAPDHQDNTYAHNQRKKQEKSVLHVRKGDTWLAAGRNLYFEEVMSRPYVTHTPGWKQELIDKQRSRPKSAAAQRSYSRATIPHIMTPSSMIYDGYTDLYDFKTDMPDISDYNQPITYPEQ
ncbi:unnamed protein product [Owenia fusiformis]|uniref:Uncharacterized protein n=1 Tax=Owenia fusiformis TaxID=6347 RepID=A0A8S4N2B0_OWEFU|nr:unnamed protein product [Owenia fusiformis]